MAHRRAAAAPPPCWARSARRTRAGARPRRLPDGRHRAPAHVLDPEEPAPAVRGHLRDAVQHHGVGHRHDDEQHTDQDEPARHSENAGEKGRRHHGETNDGGQDDAHARGPLASLMILLARRGKLSYLGISINFPDGRMRQLPFMYGIKAFEAAARTGSFAKAADELHVTPAAVSRMVHLLEDRLGLNLFERKANRLAATPAGQAYQVGLTQLFDALANLTAQVTAMGGA